MIATEKKKETPEEKVDEASGFTTWLLTVLNVIQTTLLNLAGKLASLAKMIPTLQNLGSTLTKVWGPLDAVFAVFYLAASIYLFKTKPTSRVKRTVDLIFAALMLAVPLTIIGIVIAVAVGAVALSFLTSVLWAVGATAAFVYRAYLTTRNLLKCHPAYLLWDRQKTAANLIREIQKNNSDLKGLDLTDINNIKCALQKTPKNSNEEKLLSRLQRVTLQKMALEAHQKGTATDVQKTLVKTLLTHQHSKLPNNILNLVIAGLYAAGFIAFAIPVVGLVIGPPILMAATAVFAITKSVQYLYNNFQQWRMGKAKQSLGIPEDHLKQLYFAHHANKFPDWKNNLKKYDGYWDALPLSVRERKLGKTAIQEAIRVGKMSNNRGAQMWAWYQDQILTPPPATFLGVTKYVLKTALLVVASPFIAIVGFGGWVFDKIRSKLAKKPESKPESEKAETSSPTSAPTAAAAPSAETSDKTEMLATAPGAVLSRSASPPIHIPASNRNSSTDLTDNDASSSSSGPSTDEDSTPHP